MKAIKRVITIVLALSMIVTTPIMNRQVKAAQYLTKSEIIGKWYYEIFSGNSSGEWDPHILKLKADGTYVEYYKYDEAKSREIQKSESTTYSYDENTGLLTLRKTYDKQGRQIKIEKTETKGVISLSNINSTDGPYAKASMNYYLLGKQIKFFKKSYSYYRIKSDYQGFYIRKHTLIKYTGHAKKVEVPSGVKRIAKEAFGRMKGFEPKTKKVIVPGTCKTLKYRAFAFSRVKTLVLKKGVKTLEKESLSHTYWKKIYFPKTIKKIGKHILYSEEGLPKTKLYIYWNSKLRKYFKKDYNKEKAKIIFRKK